MNPLLIDIPDHFETERLLLRVPRAGDGAAVNAAVLESLDDLRVWMPWAQKAPTLDESEEHCRQAHARYLLREDIAIYLFLKDGTFAGGSGLHRMDWDVPKFEIGYWLRTNLQGRGLMTEAVTAIANFAFDTLKAQRVEIRCDERNERSAAVARRAGFDLEACLRREARDCSGGLRDTLIFTRLREEPALKKNEV